MDNDPWGFGYKIVTKNLGIAAPSAVKDAGQMKHIVDTLFPSHPVGRAAHETANEEIPLFTEEELKVAVAALRNGKAPGPDGIPAEALKCALNVSPELLLRMYNACLRAGTFSCRWKVARLVLIDKGKGEAMSPSSYRPLCMLDAAGKTLEKLLQPRIHAAIREAGDLSDSQYGFRKGKSTADAIKQVIETAQRAEMGNHRSRNIVLLVTLDVKNAFNSVRWSDMIEALHTQFRVPEYLMKMIRDYLRDRSLVYDTTEGPRTKEITAGAAQGSILGPDLWNATYDSLLQTEMPEGMSLVAYADDVAVLVSARTVELAQIQLNRVMRRVSGWMSKHHLALALEKTDIVMLTKKRIPTTIPIAVGEEQVTAKPAVKYLGVLLDTRLNFWEHTRRAADKAATVTASLSRLMANTHGPKSSKRRLLMSTVHSILLYGAETWAGATENKTFRKRISAVQRRGALRVTCAYRTVSEPAVMVIAGVIPIDLLARERKAVYSRHPDVDKKIAREEERQKTMERWKPSWNTETRGRWTARLIPQIKQWVEREHGEVGYYLTQFLSGHGYFLSYLRKIGKAPLSECIYCQEEDSADHTFFRCEKWQQERTHLVNHIGPISPESIVGLMLSNQETWNCINTYVENVLREKRRDMDRVQT